MTRGQTVLLIGLLIWALLMIVPDLARVVHPLSSFGFYADNNGVVYDVTGPFADKTASPAWRAGVRENDQLDLTRIRCFPYDKVACSSILTVVGGIQDVTPGRTITLSLAATPTKNAREITLTAEPRRPNWFVRGVLFLDQVAGILVVLAAAWLVWTRPGAMSWGFFLYVIWFNPGQSFKLYAYLQNWPPLLLAQDLAGCISQAAGYAGLLLFVIRAPNDKVQPEWEALERTLPWLAGAIALALIGSYASAFGFKTEMLTRVTILFGLVISAAAIVILLLRRHTLTPKDNQRLRWVMWGCLIGLPAFVIADLSQFTAFTATLMGNVSPPEDLIGLLYLVNGVLCLFVFEAIRRPRVVNVFIPLRRVTLLALTMSVPALLLHHEAERLQDSLEVPQWTWFLTGAVIVFVIGQLHHGAVELADRFFNRALDRAARTLGQAILGAKTPSAIDGLLSDSVRVALKLSSAATFRRDETVFHRYENSPGWDDDATHVLNLGDADTAALREGLSRTIGEAAAENAGLPHDLEKPLLAVPSANRVDCYAVTLYGPHESGTDLDSNERTMLANIAAQAADAYTRLENEHLRSIVTKLESQLTLQSVKV
jgi:hypothetical protein